jgi:aspartate/methionine/tyrosine aminotransferase
MDIQAKELNKIIKSNTPHLFEMLSKRGKAIFFPKLGILAQSAAAQGKAINATIGTALEDDGSPLCLDCISKRIDLPKASAFNYAPSQGRADIRKIWKEKLLKKNPSLQGKKFSHPLVTQALTHGLSISGYLFCEKGDRIVLPDLYWENYDLLFKITYGAEFEFFKAFNEGNAFNVQGLKARLDGFAAGEKAIVILNFPNNPAGYTPTIAEAKEIAAVLGETASRGVNVVVMLDDAYFGLVYEDGSIQESLFTLLCDLHEQVLAIKLDGSTKEDYVWGFRVGFISFGIKGADEKVYSALEEKTAGAIRGTISNVSNLSQSLLVAAYSDANYETERKQKYELLKRRYFMVKGILQKHAEFAEQFIPVPFNSGYFMCLKMLKADPEKVRQRLLADFSTGVIVMSGLMRVAFSSTPTDKLDELFNNIYKAATKEAKG